MQTQSHFYFTRAARLVVLGLSLGPVALFAQTNEPASQPPAAQDGQGPPAHGRHMDPEQRQARMLEMMTKRLSLTPDQVTQVKGIQADSLSQEQSLRSDTTTQGPDRRTKMMDLHKAESEKVRAVLNDDQRSKFDAMQARQQEHWKERGGEQGPPPPPPAQQ